MNVVWVAVGAFAGCIVGTLAIDAIRAIRYRIERAEMRRTLRRIVKEIEAEEAAHRIEENRPKNPMLN